VDLRPFEESLEMGLAVPKVKFANLFKKAVDEDGGVGVLVAVDSHVGVKHFGVSHKKPPLFSFQGAMKQTARSHGRAVREANDQPCHPRRQRYANINRLHRSSRSVGLFQKA